MPYGNSPIRFSTFEEDEEQQMNDAAVGNLEIHDGASIKGRFLCICGQSLTVDFIASVLTDHRDDEQVIGVMLENLMPQLAAKAANLLQQFPRYQRLYLVELDRAAIAAVVQGLQTNTKVERLFLQDIELDAALLLADFIKAHNSIDSVVLEGLSGEVAVEVYKKISEKQQLCGEVPLGWIRDTPQSVMPQMATTTQPALFQLPPSEQLAETRPRTASFLTDVIRTSIV